MKSSTDVDVRMYVNKFLPDQQFFREMRSTDFTERHYLDFTVWKYCKTRLQFFLKSQHFSRQIDVFTKEVTKD